MAADLARRPPGPDGASAADDGVLRLLTSAFGTAWVTRGGAVAAAVRRYAPANTSASQPFQRTGNLFLLGNAGGAAAPGTAKGLAAVFGGEADDCGGTTTYSWMIPAFGDRPADSFMYAEQPVEPLPSC